jgi:hypothetical protein
MNDFVGYPREAAAVKLSIAYLVGYWTYNTLFFDEDYCYHNMYWLVIYIFILLEKLCRIFNVLLDLQP